MRGGLAQVAILSSMLFAEIARRPVLVWDNFPVNDTLPQDLFLGPYLGRDGDLAAGLDGTGPSDASVTGLPEAAVQFGLLMLQTRPRSRLSAYFLMFPGQDCCPVRGLKSEIRNKPVLSSWSQVIDYCRAAMAHGEIEQFRILFLDKSNKLIADELQQQGTVDHTPVYPREVVKRALEVSATAIILVHNHPSGDPTPSQADIRMTREIVQVARPLGITVHDHIIVGRDGHASFKGLQLI